jgi:Ras-related protein Rab-2A
VLRYTQDKFQDAHALTIGAAFVSKDLSIVSSSRGKNMVRLHIWDTAGEEAYRSMTRFFYREAEIGIVVYDVTNKLSFQHLDSWVNDFKEQCPEADVIIAGNKCDIPAQGRQVSLAEAEQFAADRGFVHIECSAKANINVQNLFGKVGITLFRKTFPGETDAEIQA